MTKKRIQDDIIRFALPSQLKRDLQALAEARNISLSALLRLVLSEYVKSKG
jgi:predicted transcriptional regulator